MLAVREAKRRSGETTLQRRRREELASRKSAAKIPPEPVAQKLSGRRLAVFGAVVLMVRTVVPLPTTEGGAKLHELSAGRPVHEVTAKLMVLLYPVWPAMVNVVVPEEPRDTVMGAVVGVKSKSATAVTVMAAEVEAVKFESPGYWAVIVLAPTGKVVDSVAVAMEAVVLPL
jgi:hypothetical protein